MKFKKLFIFPLLLFIIFFFAVLGAYFWWNKNSKPVLFDTSEVDFLIVKGRTASEIGNKLFEEELIRNPLAFKVYVQVTDKAGKIQAGEYKLSKNLSLPQVVDILTSGPKELWVTVPEGLRREEVVERFITSLEMRSTIAEEFRREFMQVSVGKEGFLFPDTYLFPKDVRASTVVSFMTNTFDKRITDEMKKAVSESEYSIEELVTLASIIERETKTDAERPIVAGILLNRVEIGMGLQADATVQYAVASAKCEMQNAKCDNWWPILTNEDLQIDSPYNSYKYKGLPPTPIANPGLSSLKAAIYPESSEYLYYLHDPEGNIHYAKTLEEHSENVSRYLGK